jgi:hypothetical protein
MQKLLFTLLTFVIFQLHGQTQELVPQIVYEKIPILKKAQKHSTGHIQSRGNTLCLADSIVSFGKSSPFDSIAYQKAVFTYHTDGQVLTEEVFRQDQNTGLLELDEKLTYAYNNFGVKTFERLEENDFGVFGISEEIYTYPIGSSTTRVDSIITWSPNVNDLLERETRELFSYLPSDLPAYSLVQTWDPSSSTWIPQDSIVNTYNAKNLLIRTEYFTFNGTYALTTYDSLSYNSLDSLVFLLNYDVIADEPISRLNNTYDAVANSTTSIADLYAGGNWLNVGRTILDNDANGKPELVEFFFDFQPFFTLGQRFVYTYPANNDCVAFTTDYFTEDDILWQETGPSYYYYDGSITSTSQPNTASSQLHATPNPFGEELRINAAFGNVEVYNQQGLLMYAGKSSASPLRIQTTDWPSGMYIVHMHDGATIERLKLVKL